MDFNNYKNKIEIVSKSFKCCGKEYGYLREMEIPNFCSKCGKEIRSLILRVRENAKTSMEQYNEYESKIIKQFKADLFEEFGVTNNPKADICFSKAWDRGHADGYESVYDVFLDLVELIN